MWNNGSRVCLSLLRRTASLLFAFGVRWLRLRLYKERFTFKIVCKSLTFSIFVRLGRRLLGWRIRHALACVQNGSQRLNTRTIELRVRNKRSDKNLLERKRFLKEKNMLIQ